jgi:large-conductance mechanosensitive channel
MGLVQEFKAFAMRGNVVDMAVGPSARSSAPS